MEETNKIITETNKITTFRKFKGLMIDLLKGYPEYEYFGKFESVFERNGQKIVEILNNDKIIELSPSKSGEVKRYRLTSSGINLAVSLINLEYTDEMRKLTIIIIFLTIYNLIWSGLIFYLQFFR